MRILQSVVILAMAGLASNLAFSKEDVTSLQDGPAHHEVTEQRPPALFRVQPTVASVAQAQALKGAPSPEDLALKFAIEGSALDLQKKLVICRGC